MIRARLRLALRLLIWPALLLATVLMLGAAALQTTWARDQIVTRALDASGADWSLARMEGRLFDTVRLHGLELDLDGVGIHATRLELRLSLPRLLIGRLALERLAAVDLEVVLPPAPAAAAPSPPFGGFRTPVPVDVDVLELDNGRVQLADGRVETLTHLEARLRLRGDLLEVDRLHLVRDGPRFEIDGEVQVTLTAALPWRTRLFVRAPAPLPELLPGDVQVRADLDGDLTAMRGTVRVAQPLGAELHLDALEFADLRFRGSLDLAAVRLQGVGIEGATATFAGSPERYSLSLEGTVDSAPYPLDVSLPIGLALQARGSLEALQVESLQVTGSHGNRIEAAGSADLAPPYGLTVQIAGQDLDVSAWIPGWDSRLNLDLAAAVDPQARTVELERMSVRGAWNAADARIEVDGGRLEIDGDDALALIELPRLDVKVGDNRLDGALSWRKGILAGNARIDAARLAELWPDIAGVLRGSLSSSGTLDAPRLRIDLTGDALAVASLSAERLVMRGDLVAAQGGRADLTLTAAGVRQADSADALGLDARVTGAWPQLAITAEATAAGVRAVTRVTVAADRLDRFAVAALTINQPEFGAWALAAADGASLPLGVRIEGDGGSFDGACLRGASDGRLCWQPGRWNAEGVQAELRLTALDLRRLSAVLPPQILLEGRLEATLSLSGARQRLHASASEAVLTMRDEDGEALFDDPLETLTLELGRSGRRTEASLMIVSPLAGRIEAQGHIDEADSGEIEAADADLRVSLAIADLQPFGPLIPEFKGTTGSLRGDLHLQGQLRAPRLSGTLELTGGADLPALGVRIDPIVATLTGSGLDGMRLDASLEVDDVPLLVNGQIDWNAVDGFAFQGRARGQAVPLIALPDVSASLSPDLGLDYDGKRLRITGSLDVPKALAEFRTIPEGSETLSQDVVIHGPTANRGDQGLGVDLDASVSLGRDVRIKAGKLQATVAGRLALRKPTNGLLTARGRLETTSGGVESYGESLRLSRGVLAFDGPIDNPAVDFLAVRSVASWEVGLAISGYFSALDTRLYSTPKVDDATALTMLVTGRPPSESSSLEASAVQSAALNLGISRAAPLIASITNSMGLDEFEVESPMDEDSGAIVVGKNLTKNLRARYTYGIHSRAGGLILEYQISEALLVRSETGTSNAVDLIFRREYN